MNKQYTNLNDFFSNSKEEIEEKIKTTITDKKIVGILENGKRLRPLLAYLVFKTCTQGEETTPQHEKALEGGVCVELAHAASLIHDDIIDGDTKRRGKPSYHVKKGIASAILMGHKMLVIGFNIALKHGEEWAKLYVNSWNEVVNGEIDEVNFNKKSPKKSKIFEAYNNIIDLKTASLFSSACKAAAIAADMSGDILDVFAKYGREIGLAYQLADDLVDLTKGERIDSVVLPLLNNLEDKSTTRPLKARTIKKKFAKNPSNIQQTYLKKIVNHIRKAEELSKSDIIPQSVYKDMLKDAPTTIINKMLREANLSV